MLLHLTNIALLALSCHPAARVPQRMALRRTPPLPLMQETDGGGALAKAGTTLEQALGALPTDEKYNAVLLSLLTKRAGSSSGEASAIELVREMSAKRLTLSSEALKALLDSAVEGGGIEGLLDALGAARDNGACRSFATPQLKLPQKSDARALEVLAPVPTDDRSTEVGVAAAFAIGLGALLLLEVADLVDWFVGATIDAPPLPLVAVLLGGAWGFDRYAQQGELAGVLARGLSRLFSRDLQRECAVESASFLLGYLLGLPCCAFTPTAYKPLEMLSVAGSKLEANVAAGTGGGPPRLVDRILVWLLAPAALETIQYGEMLQAEPALASAFLAAARRKEAALGVDVTQGGWTLEQDEARVR